MLATASEDRLAVFYIPAGFLPSGYKLRVWVLRGTSEAKERKGGRGLWEFWGVEENVERS